MQNTSNSMRFSIMLGNMVPKKEEYEGYPLT
jgi:hypothetical protein